ncbi:MULTISPECIES: hypothetical protein [unclassified Streptomyces]|uniref:hypothetical protein n=1 Tax=unclassified Streptomyces TaxID=2593676 RepID=UPI002E2B62D9|nr:hypothetical protein [Streptomyces sp. NBC_01429]
MDAHDPDLRKELNATLQARRDLGEEYDSALVESFLEKVERRLDSTADRQVRRQLAEQQLAAARGSSRPSGAAEGFGERFGFAVISLILAVPLSAIAVVNAGIGGLIVCWLGIVGVNALNSAHRMPSAPWGQWKERRRQESSDWEG